MTHLQREDLTHVLLGALPQIKRSYLTICQVDLLKIDLAGIRQPERARAMAVLHVAGMDALTIAKAMHVSQKHVFRVVVQVKNRVRDLTRFGDDPPVSKPGPPEWCNL